MLRGWCPPTVRVAGSVVGILHAVGRQRYVARQPAAGAVGLDYSLGEADGGQRLKTTLFSLQSKHLFSCRSSQNLVPSMLTRPKQYLVLVRVGRSIFEISPHLTSPVAKQQDCPKSLRGWGASNLGCHLEKLDYYLRTAGPCAFCM